jgi:hypothetical protein
VPAHQAVASPAMNETTALHKMVRLLILFFLYKGRASAMIEIEMPELVFLGFGLWHGFTTKTPNSSGP